MLDLLVDYAQRNDLVLEPGLERKAVKWLICCTDDGRSSGVIPWGEDKGPSKVCPTTPGMVAGGKSHFLVESLETLALYEVDPVKADSAAAKNRFFRGLLEYAEGTLPLLSGALKLLSDETQMDEVRWALKAQKAKSTDAATFRIGDEIPLDSGDWRIWWRTHRTTLLGGKPKKKGAGEFHSRCLITGDWVTPVLTTPKIKLAGFGGASAGDVVVGFDKDSFCSYGFKQSANAAMSEETAAAYAAALNYLVENKKNRLGNALSVHWYTESVPIKDDPLAWLQESAESTAASAELNARKLLMAIKTGERPELATVRYVALLLSGQSGRVMVREVMQGSFEVLAANVEAWFAALSIIARDGKSLIAPPKFLAVAGCLVRDLKDLPSPWLQQLWRAAITGGAIPGAALAQATLRARIDVIGDHPVSHARMGLLKAYHVRNGDMHMHPYLNPEHPHPAYHCGRLLAVFARLQRAALGDVGAGVVQRYYTAASQTPGLILGRLAANAKNHLGKLEGGLARGFENQIAEVMGRIRDSIPRTLSLEEQSLFALGYYQQLATLNAGKGSGKTEPDAAIRSNDHPNE